MRLVRPLALGVVILSRPLLVLATEAPAPGKPGEARPTAAEILRRAEEIRNPDLDYAVEVAVLSRSPEGRTPERASSFTLISHGRSNTMLLRRTPPVIADSVFLIAGGKRWALMPRASKPTELVEGRVIYSEIGSSDLARLDLSAGWTVTLLGEEKFEDDPCYKLELKWSGGEELYTRVVYWIGKSGFLPRRLDFYGTKPERLLQMARYEKFQDTSLGLRPTRMVVEGGNSWEEMKILDFSDPRRAETGSVTYSPEGMMRFRDVATAKREPGAGSHASAESILAALAAPSPRPIAAEPAPPARKPAPGDTP